MKILLTNHFPFHGSGTGTYVRDLATLLSQRGHEARALIIDTCSESQSKVNNAKPDPCLTKRIVCNPSSQYTDLPFNFPCFTGHPYSSRTFYELSQKQIYDYLRVNKRYLNDIIKDFDPDIIHCQHIWIQAALLKDVEIPVLVSAQGTGLMGYRKDERFRSWADTAASSCHQIIAASNHIHNQVVSIFPDVEDKTQTVLSSIDSSIYTSSTPQRNLVFKKLGIPPNPRPLVVFLGKLVPFKGVEILLKAANIYSARDIKISTIICGDGPLRNDLELLARDLELNRTSFIGDRSLQDRVNLLQYTDLVVIPSLGEPFGLVALEAMASGVPVVASAAGGLVEIIENNRGELVTQGDPVALAQTIVRAITEDWKSKKGEAAMEYVKLYHDPLSWVENMESIYQEVCDET